MRIGLTLISHVAPPPKPPIQSGHGDKKKKHRSSERCFFVLALPIFPGRLQPSIVSRSELNFRVRDGNGWTLALIRTNYSGRSRLRGTTYSIRRKSGDPYRIRTDVKGVRGLCLNHLTNGPHFLLFHQPKLLKSWYTFRDSNPGHPD